MAIIAGVLIYRFYFVPKILAGEQSVWYEISILPVVLSWLYAGIKTDSMQKLFSFSFIIAVLSAVYSVIYFAVKGGGDAVFIPHDLLGLIVSMVGYLIAYSIVYSIDFVVFLGVIRLGYLGVRSFLKEIVGESDYLES